jgi:hypothetical protein
VTRARKPSPPARRDRLRPVELVLASAGLGLFAGLVVFMGTREWTVAAIFFGVIFIVSLVVIAMLALAFTSPDEKPGPPDDDRPSAH